jgi:conjugal transfer ATP-binding protein TraC
VFSVRDLEDSLRPIAIYVTLNYLWNIVRSSLKKSDFGDRRSLVDDASRGFSAKFLEGMAKRARKYYLGITTITQDVTDFLQSKHGKPIIQNSSIQLLLNKVRPQ